MPHYYFDIETTGLDCDNDEIITIQFQKILIGNGRPETPLRILKSWEHQGKEEKILEQIVPYIMTTNPFEFVPVGNNLHFEFKFLIAKITKYLKIRIDPLYFHSRPHIDLKHVMILINGGKFKGYHLILKKTESGMNVPVWYQNREYFKIVKYIEMEAVAFTEFYSRVNAIFNQEEQGLVPNV